MPNIVIIGSECSGKTSLAKNLAKDLNTDYLEEASRIYAIKKGGELTFDDVMPIAEMQKHFEKDFLKRDELKWKIFDTCLLSTLIYSKIYYKKVPERLEKMLNTDLYDLFILTKPDPEWQDDGIRRMPLSREKMHKIFKQELVARNLNFTEVGGDIEKRIEMVKRSLNN